MPFGRTFLGVGSVSKYTRVIVARELVASFPLAVVMAVLGNLFCGFIARKALHMSDTLLAALMACNMMGLLLVGPLIGFFRTIRKVTALSRVLVGISLILVTIGLVPETDQWMRVGGYLFLGQIFLSQIGLSLVMTLRTSLWRANYPVYQRGKVVVLIVLCVALCRSGSVVIFTALMDHLEVSFRLIYVVSGVSGLAAAWLFLRLRVRQEKVFLRSVSASTAPALLAGLAVLREDSVFRKFMTWQMLNGFSTMVVEGAVLVIIVNDCFESSWLIGGAALAALPMLAHGISALFWARLFDRRDIYTMRYYGALMWTLSRVVLVPGVFYHSLTLFFISRLLSGIAMGLGQLNWRLGHMNFAPPEKDALYMGAHVCLTGLRGVVAPFLGIFLYRLAIMGPNGVVFLILSALGQGVAAWGFWRMKKQHCGPD